MQLAGVGVAAVPIAIAVAAEVVAVRATAVAAVLCFPHAADAAGQQEDGKEDGVAWACNVVGQAGVEVEAAVVRRARGATTRHHLRGRVAMMHHLRLRRRIAMSRRHFPRGAHKLQAAQDELACLRCPRISWHHPWPPFPAFFLMNDQLQVMWTKRLVAT